MRGARAHPRGAPSARLLRRDDAEHREHPPPAGLQRRSVHGRTPPLEHHRDLQGEGAHSHGANRELAQLPRATRWISLRRAKAAAGGPRPRAPARTHPLGRRLRARTTKLVRVAQQACARLAADASARGVLERRSAGIGDCGHDRRHVTLLRNPYRLRNVT